MIELCTSQETFTPYSAPVLFIPVIWLGRMGYAVHSGGGCLHAMFHSKNLNSDRYIRLFIALISLASNWATQRKQSTMLFNKSTLIVITAAIASITAAPSAAPVVTGVGELVLILFGVCINLIRYSDSL